MKKLKILQKKRTNFAVKNIANLLIDSRFERIVISLFK